MDIDALLELIGLGPRKAEAQVDAEGNYIQPQAEREAALAEANQRIAYPAPAPPSSLMDSVNHVRSGSEPTIQDPELQQLLSQTAAQRAAFGQAASAEAQQQATLRQQLQALELEGLRRAEAAAGQPVNPQPRQPFPNMPSAPQYAHLDRAGPPLQPAGAPAPQPVPALPSASANPQPQLSAFVAPDDKPITGTPIFDETTALPAFLGANMPQPPMPPAWANTSQPVPDPLAGARAGPPMVPIPQPAPSPDYLRPPRAREVIAPFSHPSALNAPRPQAEGMPILSQPRPQLPAPFRPQGPIVDAWGARPAPNAAPAQPQRGLIRPRTTEEENAITERLNREQLAEIQAALNAPLPTQAPQPAPDAQPLPQSVPPKPQVPPPQGAVPQSPPAPPQFGDTLSPAIKQQLLEAAYSIVQGRQQPTQVRR